MDLAIFALFLALLENFSPASTELQSLLIFTTATTDDQQLEELKLRWTKLGPSFESQFAGTLNGFDQRNFWTILLSRGEPDVLFADIEKAIQSDDRTKVIVGRPDGIIDRIFLSPFCWRKGITEQIAFVMCNGKLEFQIDDRGWEIDEKVEATEALRRTGDEKLAKATRSVWIDLFPGVRLATALPMQRRVKHHTEQPSKKKDQQEQQQKVTEENEGDDEENKMDEKEEGEKKEEEEDEEVEVEDKKEEDSDENAESEEKEEADGNVEEEDDEEGDDGEDDNDEEEREDNVEEEDEKLRRMMDGQSEAEQKRLCRYRLSCYAKHQIRLPEKHRQERRNPLSGKMTPPKGAKMITLKEAASKAIKKVERQEAEGKALREQYSHDGEKVLADFWSELERKNKCKYRKSCYRTGVVPNIERSPLLQWMGGGSEGEDADDEEGESGAKEVEKDFEAMDDYERKLFCRYRPSCYESGVRPRRSEKFLDFGEVGQNLKVWWSKLAERQHEKEEEEEKEQPIGPVDAVDEHRLSKLECKYRRSCYETGELPVPLRKPKRDLAAEHATKVLGGKKVPTSVKELKLFCKYRKSCYVASADSVDKKKAAAERGSTIAAATAGHNETRAADKEQLPRKTKANSEPRNGGKLLAPEAVPNHGTEKKKKAGGQESGKANKKSKGNCDQEKPSAKSKAAKSRKDEEEEEKKQKVLPVRRKHRRRPAMELRTEVAKGKQGESSEKAQNERKRKKYTVEVPVDVENEEIEKEAEEEKPNEDHLVAKEKKTKTKRYTVEEAPREVPAKVWMKKDGRGGGEAEEDVSENEEESDGEVKVGKDDDDDDEDSDEEEKEVEEKTAVKKGRKLSKLECRYRKSCYKSGVAPRRSESGDWGWQSDLGIRAFFANLMGEKPSEETQRSAADDEGEGHGHIEGWARMGEKERLFRCKYRKSCYQRMNAQAGRNDGSGRKWEEGKEKRPKSLEPMKMAQKQEAEKEGREKDQKEVETKQPRAVDMRTKLRCKYRKSCYEESGRVGKVPKVMERMAERSGPAMGNGSAAVDAKCNPWRISCRQSLGLPIREKAPIGPSGKKLCRKRRKNGDRDEEDDSGRK